MRVYFITQNDLGLSVTLKSRIPESSPEYECRNSNLIYLGSKSIWSFIRIKFSLALSKSLFTKINVDPVVPNE